MSFARSTRRKAAGPGVSVHVPKTLNRTETKAVLQRAVLRAEQYARAGEERVHVLTLRQAHLRSLVPWLLVAGAHEGLLGEDMAQLTGILFRETLGPDVSDAEAFNRLRISGVTHLAMARVEATLGRRVSASIQDGTITITAPTRGRVEDGKLVADVVSITRSVDEVLAALHPDDKGQVWRVEAERMAAELVEAVRAEIDEAQTGAVFEVPPEPAEAVLGEAG